MSSRWFRMTYARNAFLRALEERGLELDSLSLADGARAMRRFFEEHRPQHGEADILEAAWGPVDAGFEVAFVRRMSRHDHPETRLALVFVFPPRTDRTDTGTAPLETWSEFSSRAVYAAVKGARPRARRLDQD